MENVSPDPIGSLVESFLDAAQVVVAQADPGSPHLRPAQLSYELDQVVSHYLDDHQLSAEHHEALQQEVLNSIAQHLVDEGGGPDAGPDLFDPDGNAGLVDVLSLLESPQWQSPTNFLRIRSSTPPMAWASASRIAVV